MSDPITGVCIVDDKTKAPPDYEVIGFTTDHQDADLWKDKKFGRKVTRYLAFTKKRMQHGRDDVLADISVQKEDQLTPHGWTTITTTHDSEELALKKKHVIIRFVGRSETDTAVTDIFLTSGKARNNKPVESSSRSWEVKDLSLFLRFGPVVQSAPPANGPSPADLPYQYPTMGDSLDTSSLNPPIAPRGTQLTRQSTMRSPEQMAHMSAIHGVPFQLNPVLLAAAMPGMISVAKLPEKTRDEILRNYEYDFSTERLVKQQAAFTS